MSSDDIAQKAQDYIVKHGGDRVQTEIAAGAMLKSSKDEASRQYWEAIYRWLVDNRPSNRRV